MLMMQMVHIHLFSDCNLFVSVYIYLYPSPTQHDIASLEYLRIFSVEAVYVADASGTEYIKQVRENGPGLAVGFVSVTNSERIGGDWLEGKPADSEWIAPVSS
jgi:hypothetical protein